MYVTTASHFIGSVFCFTQGLPELITSRTTSTKAALCAHGKQEQHCHLVVKGIQHTFSTSVEFMDLRLCKQIKNLKTSKSSL